MSKVIVFTATLFNNRFTNLKLNYKFNRKREINDS